MNCIFVYHRSSLIAQSLANSLSAVFSDIRVTVVSSLIALEKSFDAGRRNYVLVDADGGLCHDQLEAVKRIQTQKSCVSFLFMSECSRIILERYVSLREDDLVVDLDTSWSEFLSILRILSNSTGPSVVDDRASLDVKITRRQYQILVLIDQGMSHRKISEILGIQCNTVRAHVWKLYKQLGVKNRIQAVSTARKLNLM